MKFELVSFVIGPLDIIVRDLSVTNIVQEINDISNCSDRLIFFIHKQSANQTSMNTLKIAM